MGCDFYDWIFDGDGKVFESIEVCCNYIVVIMFNMIFLLVILVIFEVYVEINL